MLPNNIAIKFARAVAAVQPVAKTKSAKVSDTFQYRYATLGDTLEAVKKACDTEGLAVAQTITEHGDRMQMMTQIIDLETGDTLTFGGPVFPVKGEPQALGSALTYLRRYSLTTPFCLNVEDDDGAQAQRAAVAPTHRTPAEGEVRQMLAECDNNGRTEFATAFKDAFGSTLSNLPESRHGDALGWAKSWFFGEEAS
jgi:hypothetical protein